MDNGPASDQAALREFLASHEAQCPRCGYQLRGTEGGRCPECGGGVTLRVVADDTRPARGERFWETVGVVSIVVSAIYFVVMAGYQAYSAAQSGFKGGGSGMAAVRVTFLLNAGTDLFMFFVAAGWGGAIWAARKRRPMPPWARPTTAGAGILLGTFVAYLILHVVRGLLT